jgi:hypothetical protein
MCYLPFGLCVLLFTKRILTQYSVVICLLLSGSEPTQQVNAPASVPTGNKYDAIAQRIIEDACRRKEPTSRKRKLPAVKKSRTASTSTRRRTTHAHKQAHRLAETQAEGQDEESDSLPNNYEVARSHGMAMSTEIHRRPDGEVISDSIRLERFVF